MYQGAQFGVKIVEVIEVTVSLCKEKREKLQNWFLLRINREHLQEL